MYSDSSGKPAFIMYSLILSETFFSLSFDEKLDPGDIAETLCFMKLFGNYHLSYYRDAQKREIDFILDSKILRYKLEKISGLFYFLYVVNLIY